MRRDRAKLLVEDLNKDAAFHCHKTLDSDNDNQVKPDSTLCVGAAIFLENTNVNGMLSNFAFRWDCIHGELSPDELSREIPVYESAEDFIEGVSLD
jgi:hypothetical protein